MKVLGRVFPAKGPARPRPEVGESLSSLRNRKAAIASSSWAEGRMMERSHRQGPGYRVGAVHQARP